MSMDLNRSKLVPEKGDRIQTSLFPGAPTPSSLDTIQEAADSIRVRRNPNSSRFHALLREMGELHDRKQMDYGKDTDPFANVRAASEWGVMGWVGAMIRLTDKVRRLQSLARKGYLANEGAKDSFMDIAVYALIAYILWEDEYAAGQTEQCNDKVTQR